MHWIIGKDKKNKPLLTKNFNLRTPEELRRRGQWVPIGQASDDNSVFSIRANEKQGYMVMLDDEGNYRALVLLD